MLRLLIQNHALVNLTFLLVVIGGSIAYLGLPRAQDPTVELGWAVVYTTLPGATPAEVEEKVTAPLEDGVEKVKDIKFYYSSSRQDSSLITIRFEDVGADKHNRRVADLRREIQNQLGELPEAASQPEIREYTSANFLPAAVVLVTGIADDENLRQQAQIAKQSLERLPRVERVDSEGGRDPELQVRFDAHRLVGLGATPTTLADTVTAYFRDLSAGSLSLDHNGWLVRVTGTNSDPEYLSELPILTAVGEIPLESVADVRRGREPADRLVRYQGQPAVMLSVYKDADANILELLQEVKTYIAERNALGDRTGVELVLLHDKTQTIRQALSVMENNALIGLLLVLTVTGVMLGLRTAVFTSIGMIFVLAGTFWILSLIGETLNVIVLLGVVITLGMLVDDAVVVVEAIHYHRQRLVDRLEAAMAALREVAAPVTTAVLTTIAAFLPLMLVPGVVGKYMQVAPFVLATALLLSLIEAFWILPSHLVGAGGRSVAATRVQRARLAFMRWLRRRYMKNLIPVVRRPLLALVVAVTLVAGSVWSVAAGWIKSDFFAADPFRFVYINLKTPPGTPLEQTLAAAQRVDRIVREQLGPAELRESGAYAGIKFTDRNTQYGDQHGQVFVSLHPEGQGSRSVADIVASLRPAVEQVPGLTEVAFLQMQTGPPTTKPISIKVRGDDYREIRAAADEIKGRLAAIAGVSDITDNDAPGRLELAVRLNPDAVRRAGLEPLTVIRSVRLLVDGQIVASMRHRGEELDVRVQAKLAREDIDGLLGRAISLPNGGAIALEQLLYTDLQPSRANMRHYDGRRAITVEAELDQTQTDTVQANQAIQRAWQDLAPQYPNIDLDFTGAYDDIQESVNALGLLFLAGLGLIYLILSTQFRSYVQPLILLATVPLAFVGVVIGLLVSGNPLSVYTMYGMVALAGISINDAIVLLTAANQRVVRGMSVPKATVYAARRRVVPILITSITTIAGLSSLAVGLAGHSLMWGPLATAIVWGLLFATLLSLFIIPVLNSLVVRQAPVAEDMLPDISDRRRGPGRGWQHLFKRLGLGALVSKPRIPKGMADDPQLVARFNEGVKAMVARDLEQAVLIFDELSQTRPDEPDAHIYAANATIMWLLKNGLDGGYLRRARRHLRNARRLAPNDPRVAELENVCDGLEEKAQG